MKTFYLVLASLATLLSADVLLTESFDAPWDQQNPPPGWTIIYDQNNPQTYADWHREPAHAAFWINHPTPFPAILWQINQNQPPDMLISPIIDCSNFRNIVLYCSTNFFHKLNNQYTAQIRYSIDGGNTFPYILRDYWGQTVGPGVRESLHLTHATGEPDVCIAWIFDGNLFDINWWAFDDVEVTGEPIPSDDIECAEIILPNFYELPGNIIPHARFRNIGANDHYNIPVYAELFDALGNSLNVWSDIIDELPGINGEEICFFDSIPYSLTIPGTYTIKIWHEATPDNNPDNDTLTRTFTVSTIEELVNDDGTPAGYLSWPVGHYGWAAKFNVTSQVYLESLKLFLNAPADPAFRRYQLAIALDDGAGNPGEFIYKTPVLTAQPGQNWNTIFMATTGDEIIVNGTFYVFYLQVGEPPECPQLGIDNNLNNPGNYWEYHRNGTTLPISTSGDLMIRAFVNHEALTIPAIDIRVTFIEQPLYEFVQRPFDASCPIRAYVENRGSVTLTNVTVICTVMDAHGVNYTNNALIVQLDPNQIIPVEFGHWTPILGGSYLIIVHAKTNPTQPEMIIENNYKRFACNVFKGNYTGRHTAGYAWIDSDTTHGPVFNWIDTTGAIPLPLNEGTPYIFVPIGFNFPWSDTTYDNCYVSIKGWVSLGPDPHNIAPNPRPLPFDSTPNSAFYPWWQNLTLGSKGKVYYRTFGTAPNRKFVVIWQDVNIPGTDTNNTITFELILNENGTAIFQYLDVETGSLVYDHARCASIGMENKEGNAGVTYLYSFPPMSTAINDLQNRITSGRAIKLYREFRDAAALDIITPGNFCFPEPLFPEVRIQNYGTVGDTIMVYFRILPGTYFDSVLVTDILPGADTVISFPQPWYGRGTFTAICSTAMTGDIKSGNDVYSKVFIASPWVQRNDVPVGPSRRRVKDASLVYAPTTGKLYALKGGNSNEFYSYDIATGTWESLPSMPLDPSGRKARDGCDLTFDRFHGAAGTIWAIKGGNVPDFYSFDIATNTWTIRRRLEVRNFYFRWPKRGAAIAFVPTYGTEGAVYCATGNNSLTFLRYDIAGDSWARCPDVPVNPTRKRTCRWGTDMVYDGDSIIYLLKGSNTTEVWKYITQFDTWDLRPLDEISLLGNRNRRVKNGGAIAYLNGTLFVLKGGNTQEFWSYNVAGPDTWIRRADIPYAYTGIRRRPKRGAAMTAGPNAAIFCLKGSSTYEFWEYRPETDSIGTILTANNPQRQGVMGENRTLTEKLNLRIYPNPGTHANLNIAWYLPNAAQVKIRVYDVTGTLIQTLIETPLPAGRHSLTWDARDSKGRKVAPGIYFVKLETGESTLSRKLIIQH